MVSGFYFFLLPQEIVAGGVTGLGLVLNKMFGFSISLTVFVFNGILLFSSLFILGKKIFIRSIYGSLAFPLVLFLFEHFVPPLDFNGDYVLAVLFGGGLLGLGFGTVLKYGGTSGGTDIPVKMLNKKLGLSIGFSVYLIDGIIVLLGIFAFLDSSGVVGGLYALIAIFISGTVADMVVVGGNGKKAMHIITDKPDEITASIFKAITRGVSKLDIKGGYTNQSKTMLITVITKQEYYVVRNIIAKIDEFAFVYVTPATEIHGDFYVKEND
jgi:uncharacterized membrane-anchored protein YitT (DUF2179 family)